MWKMIVERRLYLTPFILNAVYATISPLWMFVKNKVKIYKKIFLRDYLQSAHLGQ